ncbi:nucleotide exchange factor SIL1 [Carlito syrichta]|uniref:Nucleotide exchange factor SIL1 n=1 Tax=Carlito syrichta TaxID=1868482 RepID=A0A3Q0DSI4_CARSF|nr:nucleotide exchange factor SIL1 [Carlito syrichta]
MAVCALHTAITGQRKSQYCYHEVESLGRLRWSCFRIRLGVQSLPWPCTVCLPSPLAPCGNLPLRALFLPRNGECGASSLPLDPSCFLCFLSSNPKVQVEAIEGGALQKLLVLLATEQPLTVKKKVLFALCSLLRHFPYAQQQFLKLGGLQVLRNLVQEKGAEVLAVRVVTLLYDLVTEKMFAEEEAELTRETPPEKLQQYRQVHLLPGLQEQGWCQIIAHLLALPGHDAREKVLQTLGALLAPCRDHYRQDPQLSRTLVSLQAEYQALASLELQDGEDEGYFRELLGSVDSLLRELR